jgi:hypothetical protein
MNGPGALDFGEEVPAIELRWIGTQDNRFSEWCKTVAGFSLAGSLPVPIAFLTDCGIPQTRVAPKADANPSDIHPGT